MPHPPSPAASNELGGAERDMLAFEAAWPVHSPEKARAIGDRFGVSAVHYYRDLARLAETDRAARADPMLVARIRRRHRPFAVSPQDGRRLAV